MSRRVAVAVLLATSTGLAGAGAARASAATKPAPPVANSTQTQYYAQDKSGHYQAQVQIVFTDTTFSVAAFGDEGTFHNSGSSLTMTVHKSSSHDHGCYFSATYNHKSTRYAGTYSCPNGYQNTFAISTTGS